MGPVRYQTTWRRALLGALTAALCGAMLVIVLQKPLHLEYRYPMTWSEQLIWGAINAGVFDIGLALGLPFWMLLRWFGRGSGSSAAGVGFSAVFLALVAGDVISGPRRPLHHDAALAAVAAFCWAAGWAVAYERACPRRAAD